MIVLTHTRGTTVHNYYKTNSSDYGAVNFVLQKVLNIPNGTTPGTLSKHTIAVTMCPFW